MQYCLVVPSEMAIFAADGYETDRENEERDTHNIGQCGGGAGGGNHRRKFLYARLRPGS